MSPEPLPVVDQDALAAAARVVVRHFQRYTPGQRATHAASHRLTAAQRRATGEFFYTHPAVPGVAYGTRDRAARAGVAAAGEEARRARERPAPKVGDRVTPREGVEQHGHPVPAVEHVVVAVHDYRLQGLGVVDVVVHEADTYDYLLGLSPDLRLGPEYGLHLTLDQLEVVDRAEA